MEFPQSWKVKWKMQNNVQTGFISTIYMKPCNLYPNPIFRINAEGDLFQNVRGTRRKVMFVAPVLCVSIYPIIVVVQFQGPPSRDWGIPLLGMAVYAEAILGASTRRARSARGGKPDLKLNLISPQTLSPKS